MKSKLTTLADLGENITIIVITGGPCGGKTSALSVLRSKLTNRGYKVLIVPESATKLIGAGMLPGYGELNSAQFQQHILLDTLEQEHRIIGISKIYRDNGKRVVVLCDRGTMDGEAYMEKGEFASLVESSGYSARVLCDERYHAIMHMQTAAIGAESFYTLANNIARTETIEMARSLDRRTLEAWQRHPHPRVIDNSTDFETKIKRLFAEVCAVLGDPVPIEQEDKYLVDSTEDMVIPVKYSVSFITQDYLCPTDLREEHRVRVRQDGDGATYYFTRKRFVAPGKRVEIERMINQDEYATLLVRKDYKLHTIVKRRVCFFWKGRHFEVDFFQKPDKASGMVLMEVEHLGNGSLIELPPFVKIVRKVTDERCYSNAEMARMDR